jgi:alpha-tubulin suppressor-like RCC1 family protein
MRKIGRLYSWGDAIHSILGTGSHGTSFEPVRVFDKPVQHVSTGQHHTLFITESGALFGFGENGGGRVTGKAEEILSPVLVAEDMVDAACGGKFSVGVSGKGKVMTWGSAPKTGWRSLFGDKFCSLGYEAEFDVTTPTIVPAL